MQICSGTSDLLTTEIQSLFGQETRNSGHFFGGAGIQEKELHELAKID